MWGRGCAQMPRAMMRRIGSGDGGKRREGRSAQNEQNQRTDKTERRTTHKTTGQRRVAKKHYRASSA
jgi:hypothetical protein